MESTVASTPPAAAVTHARRLAQTTSYFAAFIALGLMAAALGPTLPSLAEQTHTPIRDIGLLFTMRALGYLIGSVQSGFLYDRFRGHPIMALALLGIMALMSLTPLTPVLAGVMVMFLLLGTSEGIVDVGGNTLLVWAHRSDVGPYMNGLHFCFGVGAFIAPIIVAAVVTLGGASLWSYWVLAALSLPAAVALLRLPSPAPSHSAHAGPSAQINYRLVALIALFFMLFVGAEIAFGGWLASYALALKLTDEATAAYLTSAFWGALTAGRLLAIPIAVRLRPRTMLLCDLLGCVISVGIMIVWSHSLTALWLGALGMGLGMASIFPTTLSFAARRIPITGRVTSWFLVGASLGSMSLPWLIGRLFERLGPPIAMIIVLIDLLAAGVVFAILMRYAGQPTPAVGAQES
jgi:MFS transporter, FHS family, Na+ dependent glucose transporter 1